MKGGHKYSTMHSHWKRRSFIKTSLLSSAAMTILPGIPSLLFAGEGASSKDRFKISLAQWSLHKSLQSGKLDHLDFAKKTSESFGIYAIEYVNQFFKDKANDSAYLSEMNKRAADHGVLQLLIMIDGEGGLAETDDSIRKAAVENHYKWVDAAKTLGCHSIRVNAFGSSGDAISLHQAAVDGLGHLATYAAPSGLNVIVENHGGLSSDGSWLSGVMKEINMPNCGTLPDFGNFCIRRGDSAKGEPLCLEEYDRYLGVEELLPYAKAVSAKSFDFDDKGYEITIDYPRMIRMLNTSAYHGYLGIEYEGSTLSEDEGIMATKKLLEKLI